MKKFIAMFLTGLLLGGNAYGTVYHVRYWDGDDGDDGTTWALAKQTIGAGIALLGPGDELIISSGTYTSNADQIDGVPSGTQDNYIIIRGSFTLGSQMTQISATSLNIDDYACDLNGKSWIKIYDIRISSDATNFFNVNNSHHIKLIRCAGDYMKGNVSIHFNVRDSSMTLMEDCLVWGNIRYGFSTYGDGGGNDQSNIIRRCVVRADCQRTFQVNAGFAPYSTKETYLQQCLDIDSLNYRGIEALYDGYKSYFTPNGSTDNVFDSCIAYNSQACGIWIEDNTVIGNKVENCVFMAISSTWGASPNTLLQDGYPQHAILIENDNDAPRTNIVSSCTVIDSDYSDFIVLETGTPGDSVNHCIIASATALGGSAYALASAAGGGGAPSTHTYNYFWGNNGERDISTGYDSTESSSTNPFPSIKYGVAIEPDSALETAGRNGGRVGAHIVRKLGKAESLYGEDGWNELQADTLWPWPNEDGIKELMGAKNIVAGEMANHPFQSCTVYPDTDVVTAANHGFSQWDYITFRGDALPAGIYPGRMYSVNSVIDSNNITVSTAFWYARGANLDFGNSGTNVTYASGWDNLVAVDATRGFCQTSITEHILTSMGYDNPLAGGLPQVVTFSTKSVTSSSIHWEWVDVSTETAYTLFDAADGSVIVELTAGTTFYNETSLSASTIYTRKISAMYGAFFAETPVEATATTSASEAVAPVRKKFQMLFQQ